MRSARAPITYLLLGLCGVLAAALLFGGQGPHRSSESGAGNTTWIVPPGRERVITSRVVPRLARADGYTLRGIEIAGGQVRITFTDPHAVEGALVVTASGPSAQVAVERQGEVEIPWLDELEQELNAAQTEEGIFAAPEGEPRPDRAQHLLARAGRAVELAPRQLTELVFLFALGLIVLSAWRASVPRDLSRTGDHAERSADADDLWLTLAVLFAIAARAYLVEIVPLETDEVRPLRDGLELYAGTHDTSLHPPLYRAVMLTWLDASGAEGAWALRAPSVVFSGIALALLALTARALSDWRAFAIVAVAPFAVGPEWVTASLLARPYALLALLAAIVLWAGAASPASPRDRKLRLALALAAGGLALYTDVFGGLMTAAIALTLFAKELRAPTTGLTAAAALVLLAAPLLYGAGDALLSPTASGAAAVAASQSAASGLGSGDPGRLIGETLGLAATGMADPRFGWLALGALFLGVLFWLRPSRPELVGLMFALVLATILVGSLRGVRARNLIVLPVLVVALLASLTPRLRNGKTTPPWTARASNTKASDSSRRS